MCDRSLLVERPVLLNVAYLDLSLQGVNGSTGLDFYAIERDCYLCPLRLLCADFESPSTAIVDAVDTVRYEVMDGSKVVCAGSYRFYEGGIYKLDIIARNHCHLTPPNNVDQLRSTYLNPIFYAFLLLLIGYIVYCLIRCIWSNCDHNYIRRRSSLDERSRLIPEYTNRTYQAIDESTPVTRRHARAHETGSWRQSEMGQTAENDIMPVRPLPARLKFLDVFRGLTICLMIFVNYGGGGYKFFNHSIWYGLTVADLVFPWFMFIMGTSMALSFNRMYDQNQCRCAQCYKVIRRSTILFALGIFIVGQPKSWSTIRIMGVLQRFGIAYLIIGLMRVFTQTNMHRIRCEKETLCELAGLIRYCQAAMIDIYKYYIEWILMGILLAVWLIVSFNLNAPGCRPWFGPGGTQNSSEFINCTGGAAGFIDRLILGENHMYNETLAKTVYGLTQSFDPEGLLGALMSTLTVFFGMQAGNILLICNEYRERIIRFLVWAFILGLIGAGLCNFSQFDGLIPIVKNLWTLSFVLCLSSFAFLLIVILYTIVDHRAWFDGAPFYFVGMNSIVIYVAHEIIRWVPVQWPVNANSHTSLIFMHLWGSAFWTIIAYIMHHLRIYVKI